MLATCMEDRHFLACFPATEHSMSGFSTCPCAGCIAGCFQNAWLQLGLKCKGFTLAPSLPPSWVVCTVFKNIATSDPSCWQHPQRAMGFPLGPESDPYGKASFTILCAASAQQITVGLEHSELLIIQSRLAVTAILGLGTHQLCPRLSHRCSTWL